MQKLLMGLEGIRGPRRELEKYGTCKENRGAISSKEGLKKVWMGVKKKRNKLVNEGCCGLLRPMMVARHIKPNNRCNDVIMFWIFIILQSQQTDGKIT